MSDGDRRAELRAEYREARREAGVYRVVNTQTGRALIASAADLRAARNRFTFAQATNSPGGMDGRLARDIAEYGVGAFAFEVLEAFEPRPGMTAAQVRDELATLESLHRDAAAPGTLY